MATRVDYSSRDTAVIFAGQDDRESYSILGGTGNDTLSGNAGSDTIQGGKGADVITGGAGADVFKYANGDGNDTIKDYEEDDVISITSGTIDKISTAKNGNVTFKVGKGKIVVENAADKVITYEYPGTDGTTVTRYYPVNFNTKGTGATLTAAYGKEEFNAENFGEFSTLLKNIDASSVPHDLAITANGNANKIIGTEEDDVIDAGKGKDSIFAGDGNDTVLGGAGNDYIEGGLGNDKLTGGSGSDTFVYNSGDGSDTIEDYSGEDGDKLQFVGLTIDPDEISTTSAGAVVFKIGKKKVTLKDAADQVITYTDAAGEHEWLPDVPAVTVKGTGATILSHYSQDSFNIADYDPKTKVKTIDASAVTSDLEIIGNKLANTITAGEGNDTLTGGKGNDKLYGGDGADTFTYANGDGSDTIYDYDEEDIIKVTSGSIKNITTNSAGDVVFKIGSGKITVKDAGDELVAYEDAQGVIHYYPVDINSKGTGATLTSDYGKDEFSTEDLKEYADKITAIDASAVEQALKIEGNKKSNRIIGTAQDDEIDGGAGADTITGGAGDDTLTGGAGKDVFVFDEDGGSDTITDYTTSDKIQIVGGTADNVSAVVAKNGDVLVSYEGGSITVKDAGSFADNIKFVNENNKAIDVAISTNNTIVYNAQGTAATLTSYFDEDEFEFDSTLVSLDASAVQQSLEITGNKKGNVITGSAQADVIDGAAGADVINGGKGNDTLTGGKDSDTFVYEKGGGKDIITDIEDADKIQIVGGTQSNVTFTTAKNGDIHINYGSGRITAKDPAAVVTVVDSNDDILFQINAKAPVNYNEEGTAATLTSYYTANSYGSDDYADYPDLATINASAVNHDLTITGNKKANRITGTEEYDIIYGEAGKDTVYGGDGDDSILGGNDNDKLYGDSGNDTLWGDKGSDTLTGGEGEDVFVYQSGDGKDTISDYEPGLDQIVVLGTDNRTKVESPIVDNAGDVTFAVGSGQIVVAGASDKYIEVLDSSGNQLQRYIPKAK